MAVNLDNYDYAPSGVIQGADAILKAYKTKDHWAVIDEIIRIWQGTQPKEYESFVFHLKDTKEAGKETNVGGKTFKNVSRDPGTGGLLERKLDIPVKVVYMIRRLYDSEELPMDKEFMEEFGKRYPKMLISEVV